MRVNIVAAAIVVALLVSAVAAYGYRQPWKADPYPAIGLPSGTGDVHPVQPGHTGLSGGLSSIDFLGQVRRQLDFGRLISLFPFSWSGGQAAAAGDLARYLGFTYERSGRSPPPGGLYYTGEQYSGRRIYVSAGGNRPGDVSDLIFLKDDNSYTGYEIVDKPAVYAYVPYGAFNANETVRFGLANNGGNTLVLLNSAPFEVQHKEGAAWRTVFYPVAAQVITNLSNGSRLEWHWDQDTDGSSLAPFGDYRALINRSYAVAFRLTSDTPAVYSSDIDYDGLAVEALAGSSPVPRAFGQAYPSPAGSLKEDVASIMQYKAWALGLDPHRLKAAIGAGDGGLPCVAIRASFDGQPAWIILFSLPAGETGANAIKVNVVTDAAGSVVYRA